MGKVSNKDAPYWRFLNLHKAYIIRSYMARCGNLKAAADELGLSYHGLRKEVAKLRALGMLEQHDVSTPGDEIIPDAVSKGQSVDPSAEVALLDQEKSDDDGDAEAEAVGPDAPAAPEV